MIICAYCQKECQQHVSTHGLIWYECKQLDHIYQQWFDWMDGIIEHLELNENPEC